MKKKALLYNSGAASGKCIREEWYQAVKFCNDLSRRDGLTPCYSVYGDRVECNFGADGWRLPARDEAVQLPLKGTGWEWCWDQFDFEFHDSLSWRMVIQFKNSAMEEDYINPERKTGFRVCRSIA